MSFPLQRGDFLRVRNRELLVFVVPRMVFLRPSAAKDLFLKTLICSP